jgi:hypothetical protein
MPQDFRLVVMGAVALAAGLVAAPAPARAGGGDTCATATVIPSLPFSDTGNTCGFSDDYDEVCPFTGSTSPDVVYFFTPGANMKVLISLCANSGYDTKVYVYEGSCPGALVGCDDDSCSLNPFVSELLVVMTVGHTYYIVVDGFQGACGDFSIDVDVVVPHYVCSTGVGCQLPDLLGHGAAGIFAATSDLGSGFVVADNFQADTGGAITAVCWWGVYWDPVLSQDCGPGTGDFFGITYWNDDAGGLIPGTIKAGPFPVTLDVKAQTGNYLLGFVAEYQFQATHPPVTVGEGECFWIEIVNDTSGTCSWLWSTAPPGDAHAAQNMNATDFDLAFCLDISIAAYGCLEACPCDCADSPDGTVNVVDFLALLADWGGAGPCDCADPSDGVVNVVDFLAMLANWGACPEPTGACCFGAGSCAEVFQTDCLAAGGVFQGEGTTCDPNPCPQPGACCLCDGFCFVTTEANCNAQPGGGIYHGDGTECNAVKCTPFGACCNPFGCALSPEPICISQGNIYLGNCTTCDGCP